jgi:alkylation response protein AidB-like acyl-CoA dehydrogenase
MVDFALTDENRLVQQAARAFAEAEILPHIRRWDEDGGFPRELFGKMAEQGFLGATVPEASGGAGMEYVSLEIHC